MMILTTSSKMMTFSRANNLVILMADLERARINGEGQTMQTTALKEAKEKTPTEFKAWRRTLIGARAWVMHCGYDARKCQAELDLVLADCRERNNAVWQEQYKRAQEAVKGRGLDQYDEQETIVMLAENRTLARGYVPPHWAGYVTCDQCGLVPCFTGAGEKVVGCPWCATPFFKDLT